MKLFTWANCGPSKDGMDYSEWGFGFSTTYYHYYNYLLPTTAARGTCVYTHKLIGREATHTHTPIMFAGRVDVVLSVFLSSPSTYRPRTPSKSKSRIESWMHGMAWAWAETTEKNHRLWVGEWIYRTAELSAVHIA